MPLFGKKNDAKSALPEMLDFSNDTWSYKGEAPEYKLQADGFSYDIIDADGNDRNAISLGIAGMIIIVLNAKSPKIKEDELLPRFGEVIKTRGWHSMTVKEANFLSETAIKKLASANSGDVFDLASYAPVEVKRALLKTLFKLSRIELKPEFREEAEHRILDDIVPEIFANPDYELAMLTGLIIKPENVKKEEAKPIKSAVVSEPEETEEESVELPEEGLEFKATSTVTMPEFTPAPAAAKEEPSSAFDELQKIYGARPDTVTEANVILEKRKLEQQAQQQAAAAAAQAQAQPAAPVEPVSAAPVEEPAPAPVPAAPVVETPAQTVAAPEPVSYSQTSQPAVNPFQAPAPNNTFGFQQSANPFGGYEPANAAPQMPSIPQPAAPNFAMQQNPYQNNFNAVPEQNNPFNQQPNQIPQPPAPNFGGQMPVGYGTPQYAQQPMQGRPQQGAYQQQPMQGYPQQQNMYQQPRQGFPQQGMYQQQPMQGYPQQGMPMPPQGFPPQGMYQQPMPGYPQQPNMPQQNGQQNQNQPQNNKA